MKLNNVKKIIELLLIKRNSFNIRLDEIELLIELQYLLAIDNSLISSSSIECQCDLNADTIEREIEKNTCLTCGRPLAAE